MIWTPLLPMLLMNQQILLKLNEQWKPPFSFLSSPASPKTNWGKNEEFLCQGNIGRKEKSVVWAPHVLAEWFACNLCKPINLSSFWNSMLWRCNLLYISKLLIDYFWFVATLRCFFSIFKDFIFWSMHSFFFLGFGGQCIPLFFWVKKVSLINK